MPSDLTLASGLAAALSRRGVGRAFGVPGGSSSLDLLEAFGEYGIEFVLTHTETAAAIMAAVTAELSGAPGVVLTGVGPGAASAVNGIAYASLERAPVVLITDCVDDDPEVHTEHQRFDQGAMFAPITKGNRRFGPGDGSEQIERMLDTVLERPFGPVHVDLSAAAARAALAVEGIEPPESRHNPSSLNDDDVAAARALLAASSRPIIIAGLEARDGPGPVALRDLADRLRCPVMTTYKAKGVVPEDAPQAVGCFTGAAAEAD